METKTMTSSRNVARAGSPTGGLALLALGLAALLSGCSSLLEVDNPNNIKAEDIKLPSAATYLVNGALGMVSQGYDYTLLPYSVATDELDWSGSRDAWGQLDHGIISDPINEFVDAAFPPMAQGRWLADEAVKTLEEQQKNGTIKDPLDLARAYLYAAMAYVFIADMYDNFVFSDRDSAGVPIGPANMGKLYDQAIAYLDKGLAIATGVDAEITLELTAMKARAQFDKGLWNLVGVRPIKTGLVAAADAQPAAATALQALNLANAMGNPDWNFHFEYGATIAYSTTGYEINIRQENRLGHNYVAPDPNNPTWLNQVVLRDPVDNIPDPVIDKFQKTFKGQRYPLLTVVSAREMHLIRAEAALAQSPQNLVQFQNEINAIRSLDGLSNWTLASGVPAQTVLQHERRVNLFLQGRRLMDHYRFNTPSDNWQPGSDGLTKPGTFFPITIIECRSNPNIGAENCSKVSGG